MPSKKKKKKFHPFKQGSVGIIFLINRGTKFILLIDAWLKSERSKKLSIEQMGTAQIE